MKTTASAVLVFLSLLPGASSARAQTLGISFVSDSTNDAVYRLADLTGDGDFNDAGETSIYYDDATGAESLQINIGVENGPTGVLYLCDSGEDEIFALTDSNADGDALDAGEISIFFDGTAGGNVSGVIMTSAQDLTWDPASGVLWIANAGVSGAPDSIIRLEDVSGDGDANDAGEALDYYLPVPGGAGGDSIPQHVMVGPDGALYYVEAGVLTKGVFRLADLDMSGTIDQANEVTTFYAPASLQSGFPTHLIFASDGAWYLSDQLSDNVLRLVDINMDGTIQAGVEDSVFYAPGASIIWEINEAPDGSFYIVESQTPDRMVRLSDVDSSGAIDQPGEAVEIYDDTLAAIDIGNPRGLAIDPSPIASAFTEACSGDGGDQMGCTDCPCGNNATQGTVGGCLNSAGTSSRLIASGSTSVSMANLRMEASGVAPMNSCVLTSGNALAPANMANPCFGLDSGIQAVSLDGLRCAVQNVLRHGVRPSDMNGDVGVTTNGWGTPNGFFNFAAFMSGDTKHFQIIHRDDPTMVCQTGQNTSQAVSATFAP